MAILPIVSFPHPILSTSGQQVSLFDEELERLSADMFETMYHANGVGLAAQQVGIASQFFVMDCEGTKLSAANPIILTAEGVQDGDEACLSLASIGAPLGRANRVRMRAQDLKGEWFEFEGSGLTARCILHETEHCNGHLFIEHLSPLKRDIVKRKFKKAMKREKR
jgi:peptide deformylase